MYIPVYMELQCSYIGGYIGSYIGSYVVTNYLAKYLCMATIQVTDIVNCLDFYFTSYIDAHIATNIKLIILVWIACM